MVEIFVGLDLDETQQARLRDIAKGDVLHLATAGADREAFGRCEVAFGNPPPEWLQASDLLRWVQLESVGFGEYTGLDWRHLGKRLTLTNLAGFFTEPVAESALAGILALYRGIDRLVCLQQNKDWQGDALRPSLRTLRGAKVVFFGFGAINRRLAELLGPFRCTIVPFGSNWHAEEFDLALAQADVVVSSVPDTPTTRGIFGRQRLSLLRKDTIFANFGRGSAVDEDALADALATESLGGAIIDVTLSEPLPREHRFWTCPNTLITQHSGGGTADELDRKIDVFADNLARFRKGAELAGTIDFSRGY